MPKSRVSAKFDRCVKSVRKTVRARKGSNKESAAIAICTKSVLQKRGRTLKKYSKGRLQTQRKLRGGDLTVPAKRVVAALQADVEQAYRDAASSVSMEAEKSPQAYIIDLTSIPDYKAGLEELITKLEPSFIDSWTKDESYKSTKSVIQKDLKILLEKGGILDMYDIPELRDGVKILAKL